jgi:hypothetical protein
MVGQGVKVGVGLAAGGVGKGKEAGGIVPVGVRLSSGSGVAVSMGSPVLRVGEGGTVVLGWRKPGFFPPGSKK